ncbi:hypothetical protein JTB14_030970 [Gonioctena quinquepunctata]|nr:hypothetical protein JTB14_030970 [Gonioctena quinquepunctata]
MSSDSSTGKSPPKKKNVKYEQKFVNSWLRWFKGWLKKSTKDAKETKILNLDFSSEKKHLPLQHIYVGGMVPNLIRRKREIVELEEGQLKNFYIKCKEFYIEAAKQILKRFPFDDKDRQALKCLKMLNPKAILDSGIKKKFPSIADLHYFFPKICPNNITELDREWRMLRNVDFWKHVHELRNGDESQTFPTLCELVKNFCAYHIAAPP